MQQPQHVAHMPQLGTFQPESTQCTVMQPALVSAAATIYGVIKQVKQRKLVTVIMSAATLATH